MKSILLTLFLFLITSLGQASEKITYDDFVMLSKPEQIKVIELIHQYLIAFETQTLLLSTSDEFKIKKIQSEYKSYETYKKIFNYFINSAYAEESTNFNDKKCYYAGWISLLQTNSQDNTVYCLHPKRITNTILDKLTANEKAYFTRVAKEYENFNNKNKSQNIEVDNEGKVTLATAADNCKSNENIICNPKIYGTHTEGNDKAGLCVVSKGNYGLNASYACDKAVQHLKKTNENQYKEHITSVIDPMLTTEDPSTNDAVEILNSMYDTCLCRGDSKKTNQVYSERIFSTRTCAGILSHTKILSSSIISACKNDSYTITDSNKALYDFILKADTALTENIVDIQNFPFPKKENQQAYRDAVEAIFQEDKTRFMKLSLEQNTNAINAGLCTTKPAAAADNNSSFVVTPKDYLLKDDKLYNKLPVVLKDKGQAVSVNDDMITKLTSIPEALLLAIKKDILLAKTPEKSKRYTLTYTGNPPILSNEFPLAPPELKCEIVKTDGSSDSEKIIKVTLPTFSTIEGYTYKKEDLGALTITQKGASFTVNNEDNLSGKLTDYKKSKPINASGTIKIGDMVIPIKCDIKAGKEDPKKIAGCSIKLITEKQGEKSYNIFTEIKYFEDAGKTKEITSSAEADSDIKTLSASYAWFDETKPITGDEVEDEVTETVTPGSLDDIDTSNSPTDSDTSSSETQSLPQTETQKLAKRFKKIEGTTNGTAPGLTNVSELDKDRKIHVALTLKKNGKTVCEATDSDTIGKDYGEAANNANSATSDRINTTIIKAPGTAFEMQH